MLWLTNNTVRPFFDIVPILAKHLCWKAASPTARTSSTSHDVRFQMGSNSKCQTDIHPARIALHWRIEKFLDVRKCDNFIKLPFDLDPRHSQDGPIQENVFATREFRMKSGSDLQEAGDSALLCVFAQRLAR